MKKTRLMEILLGKSETSVIIATLVLITVFSSTDGFFSAYNIFNVSRNAALFIFIAIGQSMVIIIGGMNVSLGAIGGLSVICFGYMVQIMQINTTIALILALCIGAFLGVLNGLVITKFKMNAFIATLSTSFIYTGLIYGISRGNAFNEIPSSFSFIGRNGFLGMPYLFWLVLMTLIILMYVFNYTVFGRQMLATGGNIQASRLSGIKTERMVIIANMLSGFFAAVSGALTVSWLGLAAPSTGESWMITSFAVSVIGGTVLSGGRFSAVGMIFSGFLIALVKNGLVMLGVNVYLEQTFLGLIILGAVLLETFRDKYLKRL